jgi:transcriptional regulator of nitric oxide reductase
VIAVNVTEDGMPSVFSSREIFQAPSSTGFTPSMPWGW